MAPGFTITSSPGYIWAAAGKASRDADAIVSRQRICFVDMEVRPSVPLGTIVASARLLNRSGDGSLGGLQKFQEHGVQGVVRGQDVSGLECARSAVQIADKTARFAHQKDASGHVPGL